MDGRTKGTQPVKKLIVMGLACCLPTGLAAEDPAEADFLPATVSVLVMEDAAPMVKDVLCARSATDKRAAECLTVHRAVLTARTQKVSLRERGRWM
jgi:hypothetical protein